MVTLLSLVQNGGIAELFDAPALTKCLGYPYSDLGCVWDLHPFKPTKPEGHSLPEFALQHNSGTASVLAPVPVLWSESKEGPQHAYSRAHVLALPFLATFLAPLLILKPKHI